jgi:16S rRNA C967 or C1407 C5-methylase (RsmB/RsmF family)
LEDWTQFSASIRTSLPACFRLNPGYAFADELRRQLLSYVGQSITINGVQVEPVVQLPWYPDGNAYQLGTDRKTIRKSEALEKLHKWMIQHTDNGNITRQEAVSMVPPLALNVQSHHKCLDMCAAPGSKTTQMLEIINESLGKSDIKDQGLVVANDSDTDRFWIII